MGLWSDDHEDEIVRGVILSILIQHKLEWVPFDTLRLHLVRGQGCLLPDDRLLFHLGYLSDTTRAYVETRTAPRGHPAVRDTFAFLRATAKAVDLRDGHIPADPGVIL